jgi:hypothetical protein
METRELEVMFPGKAVPIMIGDQAVDCNVSPLSLEDLPKVAQAFGRLMKYAEGDELLPSEIAAKGLEELLLLIPYCIDLPPSKVPATQVPDILEVIIEQNITEDVVGKWMGLVQRLVESTGSKMEDMKALGETIAKTKKK